MVYKWDDGRQAFLFFSLFDRRMNEDKKQRNERRRKKKMNQNISFTFFLDVWYLFNVQKKQIKNEDGKKKEMKREMATEPNQTGIINGSRKQATSSQAWQKHKSKKEK